MGYERQNKAFKDLFKAILEENGYYTELRHFATVKGYSIDQMTNMLFNSYEDDAPDGISIYWFMDSLEDMLVKEGCENFNDIDDIVQACYDKFAWKEI